MAREPNEPQPEAPEPTDESRTESSASGFGFQGDAPPPARGPQWPGLPGGMGFQSPERIVGARVKQITVGDQPRQSSGPIRAGFVPPKPLPERDTSYQKAEPHKDAAQKDSDAQPQEPDAPWKAVAASGLAPVPRGAARTGAEPGAAARTGTGPAAVQHTADAEKGVAVELEQAP
ncbi:MAG: hypothetical protein HOV68_13315 [Streptomycetaceae bacterium]|nr:hypothetical protein [Streptomycetaceae bacterium]